MFEYLTERYFLDLNTRMIEESKQAISIGPSEYDIQLDLSRKTLFSLFSIWKIILLFFTLLTVFFYVYLLCIWLWLVGFQTEPTTLRSSKQDNYRFSSSSAVSSLAYFVKYLTKKILSAKKVYNHNSCAKFWCTSVLLKFLQLQLSNHCSCLDNS